MLGEYAASFGLGFAASVPLTLGVRSIARRYGLVAKPRADRWHKKPTALFGGVAIFLGFLVSFLALRKNALEGDFLLLGCSSAMFLLGLVDDFVRLKPYAKLVGQIIISTTLTVYGMRLHWLPSAVLDQTLTVFWLVGIANAVNLLDNLDGLAGGVAAIGAIFLVFFSHASGQWSVATLTAGFAGAVAGFLIFNFNPASIFMGDCGSLFLGFFLGGVTMVNNQGGGRRNIVAVLGVPVLLLLIPILDTTLVTFSRKFHGRPVSQGGRDHTSHRLVAVGLSERATALVLWLLAAVSGAFALVVSHLNLSVALALLPAFGFPLLFLFIHIGRVRVYEPVDDERDSNGKTLIPTLVDFAYKRRVFEVINDAVLVVVAYYSAFLLRFEGVLAEPYFTHFQNSLPLAISLQVGAFLATGMYKGLWRYTSLSDLPRLMRSVLVAWLALVVSQLLGPSGQISRGVLVMDGVLLLLGVVGSRVSFRWFHDEFSRLRGTKRPPRRVIIYGAGDAGALLVRELQNNEALGLHPVGFIDDDPSKHGRVIHGVRVMGSLEGFQSRLDVEIDEVVVSTNKISAERTAALGALSRSKGMNTRKLRIALE